MGGGRSWLWGRKRTRDVTQGPTSPLVARAELVSQAIGALNPMLLTLAESSSPSSAVTLFPALLPEKGTWEPSGNKAIPLSDAPPSSLGTKRQAGRVAAPSRTQNVLFRTL